MKKSVYITICVIIFFALRATSIMAQEYHHHFLLTADMGLGVLAGDNSGYKVRPNIHLGTIYQYDSNFGIKANIGYGNLSSDGYTKIKELDYWEATLSITMNATNLIFGYKETRKFNIVPHIGFGQIRHKTVAINNNNEVVYDTYKINGNKRSIVFTVVAGMELNYMTPSGWGYYIDLKANHADTDWLDGFKGNGDANDWFNTFSIGIIRNLESKEHYHCH